MLQYDKIDSHKEELYEIVKNNISEQFTELNASLFMQIDDADELNIKLNFENTKDPFLAKAYYRDSVMTFNLDAVINQNQCITMIHEKAHFICYKYGIEMGHNFEFAIIYYSLLYFTWKKDKDYFTIYDVKDDLVKSDCRYKIKSFDTVAFDNLIKSIHYDTYEELARKSKRIAKKIRERYLVKVEDKQKENV